MKLSGMIEIAAICVTASGTQNQQEDITYK